MRKSAAILWLALLLFNAGGFQFFHAYMQGKMDARLESQLDNNSYDDARLLSIKVSASILPYYTNSWQFTRVDGQVEIDGILYKYVKRRVFNDSLELLCIPDPHSMKLLVAKNNYFSLVNDLQASCQGKKSGSAPHIYKSLSIDYCSLNDPFSLSGVSNLRAKPFAHFSQRIPQVFLIPNGQPPEMA